MTISNFACAGSNGNTGIPACSWSPSNITGAIMLPKGKTYSKADIASFWSTLQADAKANTASSRIYPIGAFKAMEDNSTEIQIETDGYGGKSFVRDGDYDFTFEYKNGFCFYQKLRTFHNKGSQFTVVFIDEINNVLWGTTASNGEFTGFSLELLLVPNIKVNTGAAATKYYVRFGLADATELNDSTYAVAFQSSQKLMQLSGLLDISLTQKSALTALGVTTLSVKYNCNNEDLGDVYPTEIITPAIWSAKNKATGNAITVTTVTYNAVTKLVTVDLDSSDPDYPTANGVIVLTLGNVTALEAAGIVGFAGTTIEITVP